MTKQMDQFAELKVEQQKITAHSCQLAAGLVVFVLKVSLMLHFASDLVALASHKKLAGGDEGMKFEAVRSWEVAYAEVIEEASALVILADQRMDIAEKAG